MSNYLTQPADYGKTISVSNVPLLYNVLSYRQGKYDQNKAMIDQTLQQYGEIDLKPADKDYLAQRLQGIVNLVNQSGSIDFSRNNVASRIQGQVKLALDDRVLTGFSEMKKFRNYENQVGEVKSKKPELYSDLNYSYGLEKSNSRQWYNDQTGEVRLGELNYTPYSNVPAIIDDKVSKWAKDAGLEKMVTQDGSNPYYIVKATHERVSEDKIKNYINSIIDPNMAAQMKVNSWGAYGGDSPENLTIKYDEFLDSKINDNQSQIAKLEAEKANQTGENLISYEKQISDYTFQNENYTKQKGGNYNRDTAEFQMYHNGLLNSFANNYKKDMVTDIDYDDMPLQIKKYELDVAKAAGAKTDKNGNVVAGDFYRAEDTGAQINDTEDTAPYLQKITSSVVDTQADLDKYLVETTPEYAKMSNPEKKQYRVGLIQSNARQDLNAKGYSDALVQKVDAYVSSANAYTDYKGTVNQEFDKYVAKTYDALLGGKAEDLVPQNLAGALPTTSRALVKGTTYNNLSPNEKALVNFEVATNFLAEEDGMSNKEKMVLRTYVAGLKNQKNLPKEVKQKMQDIEDSSSSDGFATYTLKSQAINAKRIGMGIMDAIDVVNPFLNAEEKTARFNNRLNGYNQLNTQSNQLNNRQSNNLFTFNQDTGVSEIESSDITLAPGVGLSEDFRNTVSAITQKANEKAMGAAPNKTQEFKFTFNPAQKAEIPVAQELQKVIFSKNNVVPDKESLMNLTVNEQAQTATIDYNVTTGSGKDKVTSVESTTVSINELPPIVKNNINTQQALWSRSVKNPYAVTKTFDASVMNTANERELVLRSFTENNPNVLTNDMLYNLQSNPLQSPFKTKQDWAYVLPQQYGQQFVQNNAEPIAQILNSKYSVKYEPSPSKGYVAKVYKDEVLLPNGTIPTGKTDFDNASFNIQTRVLIDQIIQSQIKDLYLNAR